MVVVLPAASRQASQAGGCRTVGGGAQRPGPSSQGQADGFWKVLSVIATNFETDYKGKERAGRTVAVAGALLSGVMYRSGRLV